MPTPESYTVSGPRRRDWVFVFFSPFIIFPFQGTQPTYSLATLANTKQNDTQPTLLPSALHSALRMELVVDCIWPQPSLPLPLSYGRSAGFSMEPIRVANSGHCFPVSSHSPEGQPRFPCHRSLIYSLRIPGAVLRPRDRVSQRQARI